MKQTVENRHITSISIVPGMPHPLLAAESSPAYKSLAGKMMSLGEKISLDKPDCLVVLSAKWFSILGYMVQGKETIVGRHVDENWHELGTMPYEISIDMKLAHELNSQINSRGHLSKLIDYEGFPIDTGTIVAHSLLNPKNLPLCLLSTSIYSDKDECEVLGAALLEALKTSKKRVAIVVVNGLSDRLHTEEIPMDQDYIVHKKDDKWNRFFIDLLSDGGWGRVLEELPKVTKECHFEMGFKNLFLLNGLLGSPKKLKFEFLDYQSIWGSGAALLHCHKVPSGDSMVSNSNNMIASSAPKAVGSYPHIKQHNDLLFLSGIGSRVPDSKEIPKGIEAQTHQVFRNLQAILTEANCSFSNIIDVQVFLTNMKQDFSGFNQVYGEYFTQETGPSRTTVEVGALPTPISVEFKVIAKRNSK